MLILASFISGAEGIRTPDLRREKAEVIRDGHLGHTATQKGSAKTEVEAKIACEKFCINSLAVNLECGGPRLEFATFSVHMVGGRKFWSYSAR
jgi:hypothetical protein